MPPPVGVRATVTIPAVSGVARDAVQFSLDFANTDPAILTTSIVAFLNSIPPSGVVAINGWLSPSLSRVAGASTIKFYDISAQLAGTGVSGPPVLTTTFGLGGGGGSPLPSELATVLSFHADMTAIPEHGLHARPRARYRGRIYIGPLSSSALLPDSTSHRAYIADGVRTSCCKAAQKLLADQPAWSVWSRKDRVLRTVVGGWMDDAFDIQRRRGEDPVSRLNWP